jgi:crossover junction endodeoxyribonuclease RuvC/BirA family biotin operon repressor/biotin-[acetyl-CoA-carboxylase] ligase
LDGGQHTISVNLLYDTRRSRWLVGRGYRVIRFANTDVLKDVEMVLDGIWHALKAVP